MSDLTHRFQVGALTCIVVADGNNPFTEERIMRMFGQTIAEDDLMRAFNSLDDSEKYNSMNCLVVQSGDAVLLCDTGMGEGSQANGLGQLVPGLQAEGIAPEDVTHVFITHFHGDHIAGLIKTDGSPAFPNAAYLTGRDEWAYWTSEDTLNAMGDRADMIRQCAALMETNLTLLDAGDTVIPGVTLVAAYGHTPGHMALWVESDGKTLLNIVDAAHALIQMKHIDWSPVFDSHPDISPTSRRAMFEKAAQTGTLTLAYHFPFPGLGHIEQQGDVFTWKPLDAS